MHNLMTNASFIGDLSSVVTSPPFIHVSNIPFLKNLVIATMALRCVLVVIMNNTPFISGIAMVTNTPFNDESVMTNISCNVYSITVVTGKLFIGALLVLEYNLW